MSLKKSLLRLANVGEVALAVDFDQFVGAGKLHAGPNA
jgi:hypothetical protein